MQGTRDGGRTQTKTVDIRLHLLEPLLVFNPEALFLVNNHQPQIFKLHIFLDNAVCADNDIKLAVFQLGQHFFLFSLGNKAGQPSEFYRKFLKAFLKGIKVLLREDGGRR